MIKNLLFVGKMIYLISPESDATFPQEAVKEEEQQQENGDGDEDEGEVEEEAKEKEVEEEDEDQNEKDDRPPSLLWLIKKLSLMAKREAAYAPKVPLKVIKELLKRDKINNTAKRFLSQDLQQKIFIFYDLVLKGSVGKW